MFQRTEIHREKSEDHQPEISANPNRVKYNVQIICITMNYMNSTNICLIKLSEKSLYFKIKKMKGTSVVALTFSLDILANRSMCGTPRVLAASATFAAYSSATLLNFVCGIATETTRSFTQHVRHLEV